LGLIIAFSVGSLPQLLGQGATNGGFRVYNAAPQTPPVSPAPSLLDNEAIIKLVKAGLGEELIIGMVTSQPGKYALAADDVLRLKEQKVPDKVILAMITKSSAAPVTSGPSQPPATPAAPTTPVRIEAPPPAVIPLRSGNLEIGVYFRRGGDIV